MHTQNSELIAAIIDGDIHRYGEIVQRFDRRVRRAVASRVTDQSAVEDIVQETFYKAFKRLGTLQNFDRLEAWLLTIASNCVVDHFRRQPSTPVQITGDTASATSHPAFPVTRTWIWEEVDGLVSEHAEVLRQRYQFSLTYEEIAARLSIPESTVRGRIFEARKSLRERLQNKGLFP